MEEQPGKCAEFKERDLPPSRPRVFSIRQLESPAMAQSTSLISAAKPTVAMCTSLLVGTKALPGTTILMWAPLREFTTQYSLLPLLEIRSAPPWRFSAPPNQVTTRQRLSKAHGMSSSPIPTMAVRRG